MNINEFRSLISALVFKLQNPKIFNTSFQHETTTE